jgi:aldehyde:ferredoxin oxidoreductase
VKYTPERLEAHFGDAVQRDLALNRRFGVTKAQDTLPDRFLNEPLTEGPTSGSVVDLPRMLDEYYRLHER